MLSGVSMGRLWAPKAATSRCTPVGTPAPFVRVHCCVLVCSQVLWCVIPSRGKEPPFLDDAVPKLSCRATNKTTCQLGIPAVGMCMGV